MVLAGIDVTDREHPGCGGRARIAVSHAPRFNDCTDGRVYDSRAIVYPRYQKARVCPAQGSVAELDGIGEVLTDGLVGCQLLQAGHSERLQVAAEVHLDLAVVDSYADAAADRLPSRNSALE